LFLGIAARRSNGGLEVGFCTHDGTYSTDFAVHTLSISNDTATELSNYIVSRIQKFQEDHLYKFLGAGISEETLEIAPGLSCRIWKDLDIIPLVFDPDTDAPEKRETSIHYEIDEIADSMARRCIMLFGPAQQPRVQVGFQNQVDVDAAGHALMNTTEDYRQSAGELTWQAVEHFAERIKKNNIKIAFFNSTPQGGGVALVRLLVKNL